MGLSLPQLFLSFEKEHAHARFITLRKMKIEVGIYAGKMVYKKHNSRF